MVHAVADDEREMAGTTRWSMGGGQQKLGRVWERNGWLAGKTSVDSDVVRLIRTCIPYIY